MHIYKWTHKESRKSYIGQSVQDPERRIYEHTNPKSTASGYFKNALQKYGVDAFEHEIIAWASDLDELNQLEVKYIKEFDTICPNGYNLREGGNGNGRHHPESIEKMRQAQISAHARRKSLGTDTWSRKDGGPMKGKKFSEEHKEKIRQATMGRNKGMTWKLVNGKRVWMEK